MRLPLSVLLATAPVLSFAAVVAPDPDAANAAAPLAPRVVTEPARYDTDDPSIWINRANPAASLVIGTDKDADGALYVYDLAGKIQPDKVVRGLLRPNNVDLAYDVALAGKRADIAIVTERHAHRLRAFRLPDMAPVDGGGIPVFEGEIARDCMGIALYTRPSDGALFAIVSRSEEGAPQEGYLHQYRLVDDGTGTLRGLFVRRFGKWSGKKEIEALAVDNELGYVYCSDERHGIRKYHADPLAEDADKELACFGTTGFANDHEGISFYTFPDGTGYILVSNQQADTFRIFPREGAPGRPHEHALITSIRVTAHDSDGSDVTTAALPGFPGGLFVAMSTDRTFHYYAWDDLVKASGGKLRSAGSTVQK
jgi:3-phytase